MSAKAISEASAKAILYNALSCKNLSKNPFFVVTKETSLDTLDIGPLKDITLVSKPDVLIKRRGKLGLIALNKSYEEVKDWLTERLGKQISVNGIKGSLDRFMIEPCVPHQQFEEYYLCMYTQRDCDTILFHHEGGVSVGDVDEKAKRFDISVADIMCAEESSEETPEIKLCDRLLRSPLLSDVKDELRKRLLADFISELHRVFVNLHFTYLEINPLVVCDWTLPLDLAVTQSSGPFIHVLDAAAKVDQCAEFLFNGSNNKVNSWFVNGRPLEFPVPFGRTETHEEAFIANLDARTGASMKLSVLNPQGRIWTMCAGGGASVIYADTVCSLAEKQRDDTGQGQGAMELANYGEYSGAPSEGQTYDYAKTILNLMTHGEPRSDGKVLLIGGGIANFTNVASTFKGIVRALKEFRVSLQEHRVRVFVRRAGPNYQEGLRLMRELGPVLGIPVYVFGPETHMTAIVSMALGLKEIPSLTHSDVNGHDVPLSPTDGIFGINSDTTAACTNGVTTETSGDKPTSSSEEIFTPGTRCIVWGLQVKAVQSMLDFDYICYREQPSVAALVYTFGEGRQIKVYYGSKEIFIPVYKDLRQAMQTHPDARVLVNFASFRVAYEVAMEAMAIDRTDGITSSPAAQLRCIAIIAEGIPENWTRRLIVRARERGVLLIGPATVGGIKPGCFKIGNTGGMVDNILASRLYRPGSVAYVSRSGGMSNELNNIISLNSDGVEEGVAIGGDRYPGSTFLDHVLRFEDNPNISMIVLLGEVGGTEEYRVAEAVRCSRVKKPLVAWCIGTCAQLIGKAGGSDAVQFGHAGACANSVAETAGAKNAALAKAGLHVPVSFDEMGTLIRDVFQGLVKTGAVVPKVAGKPRPVPIDFAWARELGLVRRPTAFTSTICDDRGAELLFAGVPITQVISESLGIGGVLGLLWFKRRLPDYAMKFFELCLVISADHGPAVSGALNTIVTARAGKDLLSSLAAGLLTIGDRFGGALDGAARQFSAAFDAHITPAEFVANERRASRLIMGIGHRVKSITNPDMRVQLLSDFVHRHFPACPLVDFAFEVEKVTTAKRPNLILNVDGIIGVAMVDLLRHCGQFTREEADEYVSIGTLNALFVLGRSIGFIGHYLDQRRLHQDLYRHPWEDISYMLPEGMNLSD